MEKFKKVGFYEICIKILEGNNSKKSELKLIIIITKCLCYCVISVFLLDGTCTPNLDAFITRSNQVMLVDRINIDKTEVTSITYI